MSNAILEVPVTTAWQIDASHTGVEFAVKHLMISSVKGRFSDVSGLLTGDISNPETFGLAVTIGVASIDTRQEMRDNHLRSADFFDAAQFPTIEFKGQRVDGDTSGEFKLYGDLTIRGTTREVGLDVTNEGAVIDPWGGSRIGFSAKGKIDRREFGLTYNQALEAGGFVVGDDIKLSIDVEFTAVAG
ncbi:MAG: YceI family protein [Gemmatimonadaceae bacterium]